MSRREASIPMRRARVAQRGFSLIIALLMLAVIGLASAAIMRNALSADQVATNNRLQTQAGQYAQVALRLCEYQLTLAGSARGVTPFAASATASAAWMARADWTGGGTRPAHTLAAAEFNSAVAARVAPQCLAEATSVANVFTVTARGFSPDFTADPGSGATRSGAVVWLQSTVWLAQDAAVDASAAPASSSASSASPGCSPACPSTVRQRVWQQLLTPPF